MAGPMKILHTVEFYSPSVGGMQEVVKQLSERLVRYGHDVTVATTYLTDRTESVLNGVKIVGFDIRGNQVRGLHGDIDAYRTFLRQGDFDVIVNFAAQQWATDIALDVLDQLQAAKVFVPTGFSGLYSPEYKGYFARMPDWLRMYDANVFLSDDYRDINFARENGIDNIHVIPNGAGHDEFSAPNTIDIRRQLGIPTHHQLLLHVGSHTGVKGHAEAIAIFRAAKIKDATLLIVANDLGGGCTQRCKLAQRRFQMSWEGLRDRKRLIVKSLSRPDTVSAYHQANLFLFPSNIECSPLVLFECLASRTPFLTTNVGNAAEIIAWSAAGQLLPTVPRPHGFVGADVAKSAQLLTALARDEALKEQMSETGYRAWIERFTWETIAGQYNDLYASLVTRAGRK